MRAGWIHIPGDRLCARHGRSRRPRRSFLEFLCLRARQEGLLDRRHPYIFQPFASSPVTRLAQAMSSQISAVIPSQA